MIGLVVICIVFQAQEDVFLSSRNIVSITQFAAPIGIISLGIVLVLLLGRSTCRSVPSPVWPQR